MALCNGDIHVYTHHTGLRGLFFFYLMEAKKRLVLMKTMKYNDKGTA